MNKVIQVEYYPFGLQASTSWTRENNKNDFLYNAANELNSTTGWYEMFYRGYDPAIGRMLQVDPYAAMYSSHTPYNYALNSPALLNDPFGGQTEAPPGVSQMGWNRMNRISQMSEAGDYYADWGEDFSFFDATGGSSVAASVSKAPYTDFWKAFIENAGYAMAKYQVNSLNFTFDNLDDYTTISYWGLDFSTAVGNTGATIIIGEIRVALQATSREIEVLARTADVDVFRETTTYGSPFGPKTVYRSDIVVRWDEKGKIVDQKGLIRISQYDSNNKEGRVQWKVSTSVSPQMREFIDLVTQYRNGDLIAGDHRTALQKYIDFVREPSDNPSPNPFAIPDSQKNAVRRLRNGVTSPTN